MPNAFEICKKLNDLLARGIIRDSDFEYLADMRIQDMLSKYPNFPTAPQSSGYWRLKLSRGSRNDRRIKSKTYVGLVRKLEEYENGTLGRSPRTFEQLYRMIQQERLRGISDPDTKGSKESTISRQDGAFKRYFARTELAAMPLNSISANDIHRFLLMNLLRYNMVSTGFAEMKRILVLVFRRAYQRGIISVNPSDRIEWDSDEYSNKFSPRAGIRERTYSDDEMNRLWDYELDVLQEHPTFLTAYAMLLQMQTGLRRGEVCALQWIDITTDSDGRRYLTVCRRLRRVPKCGDVPEQQCIVNRTKTSVSRTLPIWPELEELLAAIHEISGDDCYIFPGDSADGCLGFYAIYAHYRTACLAVGIPTQRDTIRGPHAWRRNFARRIGDSSISSRLLGNDPRVCEKNYSDAIDMDHARAVMEQHSLHRHLASSLTVPDASRKTA